MVHHGRGATRRSVRAAAGACDAPPDAHECLHMKVRTRRAVPLIRSAPPGSGPATCSETVHGSLAWCRDGAGPWVLPSPSRSRSGGRSPPRATRFPSPSAGFSAAPVARAPTAMPARTTTPAIAPAAPPSWCATRPMRHLAMMRRSMRGSTPRSTLPTHPRTTPRSTLPTPPRGNESSWLANLDPRGLRRPRSGLRDQLGLGPRRRRRPGLRR